MKTIGKIFKRDLKKLFTNSMAIILAVGGFAVFVRVVQYLCELGPVWQYGQYAGCGRH